MNPGMPVGTVFDTAVEKGCVVTMSVDEFGGIYGVRNAFLATSPYDDHAEPCQYLTAMVVGHPDYRGPA